MIWTSSQSYSNNFFSTIFLLILLLPIVASSNCTCTQKQDKDRNQSKQLIIYKLVAIVSVLVSGALGVCLPFLVKINIPFLHPDNDFYLLVKAFAAGVILATGFVHVLPDAQESLTSPCLSEKPWGKFPFTGFVAMVSAIGTLMMESMATGYNKRSALSKPQPIDGDEETEDEAHHVHGSALALESSNSSDKIRNRIISQVIQINFCLKIGRTDS